MRTIVKILIVLLSLSIFVFPKVKQENNIITIVSPSENTTFYVNRREGISWISSDTSRIDIQYSFDSKEWKSIFVNIRADLEYLGWKVATDLNGSAIKIRFVDSNTQTVLDETDYWIKVTAQEADKQLLKSSQDESVLKILPMGNSITFDNRTGDSRDVKDKIGYRFPLYQYLNNAGISFDFIGSEQSGSNFLPIGYDENAGIPGIKDHELAELLKTGILNMPFYGIFDDTITSGPYLETYIPDIILLHIGTNGNTVTGGAGTLATDVEDILDEVDRVELLLGKSIDVFVARIIDRVSDAPEVGQFNNNVQNMIYDRITNPVNPAYPDNIHIVDMENGAGLIYSISPDPNGSPGDMNDDLHPNDKGYSKIAGKWFTNIKASLLNFPLNMISYWSLDDIGSTTYTDRLGTNNLTCTNCPSSFTGMNDNSLLFVGTNQLIAANNFSINNNLSGNFTVECWIQTTQTGVNNKVFIGKQTASPSWWLGLNSADGLAKFSVRSHSGDRKLVSSTSIINDGFWHHIVGVKDHYNKVLRIYVDGVLENQIATNFTGNFSGVTDLSIGAYINDYFIEGSLDEMTIYDKALSQSEIEYNYNRGLKGQDNTTDTPSYISTNLFLEGAYTTSSMSAILFDQDNLPERNPFNVEPWNFNGAESVTSIPNLNPLNKIVDWVLVSLRAETNKSSVVAKRAGFILQNGSVVDLDGESPLLFTVNSNNYYLVLEHRNHLPIMSGQKLFITP